MPSQPLNPIKSAAACDLQRSVSDAIKSLVVTAAPLLKRIRRHFFATMLRDETSAADYFGLPPNQVVEIGAQIVL